MAGEKNDAYSPEMLVGGREPDALNFAKHVFMLVKEKPRDWANLTDSDLAKLAHKHGLTVAQTRKKLVEGEREIFRDKTESLRRSITLQLEEIAKKGDDDAAKFFKAVGSLIASRIHREPLPGIDRIYLKGLTEGPGPFNATELMHSLSKDYGRDVSHSWIRSEMKKLGKPLVKKGWPRS
jgi:hypothetical protein